MASLSSSYTWFCVGMLSACLCYSAWLNARSLIVSCVEQVKNMSSKLIGKMLMVPWIELCSDVLILEGVIPWFFAFKKIRYIDYRYRTSHGCVSYVVVSQHNI